MQIKGLAHARTAPLRAASAPATARASLAPEAEVSRLAYEDLVLFLLQQECDVALQRALNKEDYDLAQAVRDRRTKVDEAAAALKDARDGLAAAVVGGAPPVEDAVDVALEAVRLRSELSTVVEAEDYAAASRLRDALAAVDKRMAAAAGRAARLAELAAGSPALRLGQRVTHAALGYRGAICGWDPVCTETDEWQAAAGVAGLDPQPCYVVLVDERDWNPEAPPVAYVPQERLVAPADPDTWLSVVKDADEAALENPLTYLLFLGPDERGDLVPTRALRERHGAARRDVFPPGGGGEGEDE